MRTVHIGVVFTLAFGINLVVGSKLWSSKKAFIIIPYRRTCAIEYIYVYAYECPDRFAHQDRSLKYPMLIVIGAYMVTIFKSLRREVCELDVSEVGCSS